MLASLYLISFLVFEASIVLTLGKVNKKSVNNLLSIHKKYNFGVKSKKKAKTKKKEYKRVLCSVVTKRFTKSRSAEEYRRGESGEERDESSRLFFGQ